MFSPDWVSTCSCPSHRRPAEARGRRILARSAPRAGRVRRHPARGPSGPAVPDIYQWLPFTQSDLASASATTISFAAHYGTFSYTQSAQAYLAPMRPEITSQLADVLGQAFAAPGLAATRASTRQTSTGTASILALRAFGPSSLTFVVAVAQRITSSKGTSEQNTDYSVTLTGTGSAWQVSDIELASAGNH